MKKFKKNIMSNFDPENKYSQKRPENDPKTTQKRTRNEPRKEDTSQFTTVSLKALSDQA